MKKIDVMNDHGLEQLVHLPTREKKKKNILDLLLTSLPASVSGNSFPGQRQRSIILLLEL